MRNIITSPFDFTGGFASLFIEVLFNYKETVTNPFENKSVLSHPDENILKVANDMRDKHVASIL